MYIYIYTNIYAKSITSYAFCLFLNSEKPLLSL